MYSASRGKGGEPTHDWETGRDDADARLDAAPYEDA